MERRHDPYRGGRALPSLGDMSRMKSSAGRAGGKCAGFFTPVQPPARPDPTPQAAVLARRWCSEDCLGGLPSSWRASDTLPGTGQIRGPVSLQRRYRCRGYRRLWLSARALVVNSRGRAFTHRLPPDGSERSPVTARRVHVVTEAAFRPNAAPIRTRSLPVASRLSILKRRSARLNSERPETPFKKE
jgi:hypothetical protein